MSEPVPSEGLLGWARVGCGAGVVVVLPMWIVLSALVLHANDSWVGAPGMLRAMFVSGFWMGVGLALIFAVLLVWRGTGRLAQMRDERERQRLDAELADDAALPESAWDE